MADSDSTIARRTPWLTVPPDEHWTLPSVGGCYAFYVDGVLSYIGQTRNLRGRLGMHNVRPGYFGEYITPWGPCRSVGLKVKLGTRYGEWAMREIRLINRLRPRFNARRG